MNALPPSRPFPGIGYVESCNPLDVATRIMEETARRCNPIDNRLDQLVAEFSALSAKREQMRASGSPKSELVKVTRQMDINRDLRVTLYRLRWRNT